jgi:hypothetical protein
MGVLLSATIQDMENDQSAPADRKMGSSVSEHKILHTSKTLTARGGTHPATT